MTASTIRHRRDAGDINVESGFGPWPDGLKLLDDLRLQRDDPALQCKDLRLERDDGAAPASSAPDDLERHAA